MNLPDNEIMEQSGLNPDETKMELTTSKAVYPFALREVMFLDAVRKRKNLRDAAKAAGMTLDHAYNFLNKPETKNYMTDLAYERLQLECFGPDRWVNEGLKVWNGEKKVDRQQMVVWQELGNRIMPRAKDAVQDKGPTITINIGALEEAQRRIAVTQTDVVNVPHETIGERNADAES